MTSAKAGDDGYRAVSAESRAEIRDRGSRFLAVVAGAVDEPSAREQLDAVRSEFGQATHHCWAWRLGPTGAERSSDDGEPSGTAGVPILQVLRGAELSDVVAVVVRWYGGTKLGKGGLARAYAAAVREALGTLEVALKVPTVVVEVAGPYSRVGALKRLIRPPAVELIEESYGVAASWKLRVERRELESLATSLADLGLTLTPTAAESSPPEPP